MSTHILYW